MEADKSFPAGLCVLAVDDDRISLMILKRQLQLCKYDVTTVTDAKTALQMLRERKDGEEQFDLVISDVVMPDMDGFQLLEHIGLEMDIPVIMLSVNSETETIMKGIKHGACDYLVKPVRLEQIRNIWQHVVRKSKADPKIRTSGGSDGNGQQKLQSGDEREGPSHSIRKYSKKNKKDGDGAEEGKEDSCTIQKRQRIQWSGDLHRKFVEAVNQIGMDRAVPKKILEVMNVDGLNRENVASHLQKYRQYLRKLNDGTLKGSNPFIDEPLAWQTTWRPITSNTNAPGSSSGAQPEVATTLQPSPSLVVGSSSSTSPSARMDTTPAVFGTHTSPLPSHSADQMPGMEMEPPAGHGANQPGDDAPLPGPGPVSVQDVARYLSSCISRANAVSGGPSATGQGFASAPSGSSFSAVPSSVVFSTTSSSGPLSLGTPVSSSANTTSVVSAPAATSTGVPTTSCTQKTYASILRSSIIGANKGIPFDADSFHEELANAGLPPSPPPPSRHSPLRPPQQPRQQPSFQIQSSSVAAPSSHVPQPPPQPPVQMQPSSAGLISSAAREARHFGGPSSSSSNQLRIGVPSRFPDLGTTSGGSSQGEGFRSNQQVTGFAASSSQVPGLGNEYHQNKMAFPVSSGQVSGFGNENQYHQNQMGLPSSSGQVPVFGHESQNQIEFPGFASSSTQVPVFGNEYQNQMTFPELAASSSQVPTFGNEYQNQMLLPGFASYSSQVPSFGNEYHNQMALPGFAAQSGQVQAFGNQYQYQNQMALQGFDPPSGQIQDFGAEYQNQMAGPMGRAAPMIGFSEQVETFNFGSDINSIPMPMPMGNPAPESSSSIRPAMPNLQIGSSVMRTQTLNDVGETASGNLPEGGPVGQEAAGAIGQEAAGDQVNNSNVGTDEEQNAPIENLDDFFAEWVNQDDFTSGDAFLDGNWDFAP